jgi:hypothetical protein
MISRHVFRSLELSENTNCAPVGQNAQTALRSVRMHKLRSGRSEDTNCAPVVGDCKLPIRSSGRHKRRSGRSARQLFRPVYRLYSDCNFRTTPVDRRVNASVLYIDCIPIAIFGRQLLRRVTAVGRRVTAVGRPVRQPVTFSDQRPRLHGTTVTVYIGMILMSLCTDTCVAGRQR